MIECFKCGQKNEYDSKFCSNCGSDLVAKKDFYKRYDIKEAVIYRCPSCGFQREEKPKPAGFLQTIILRR